MENMPEADGVFARNSADKKYADAFSQIEKDHRKAFQDNEKKYKGKTDPESFDSYRSEQQRIFDDMTTRRQANFDEYQKAVTPVPKPKPDRAEKRYGSPKNG